MNDFSKTRAIFESGIRDGLHLGAQLYVSRDGQMMVDEAFGRAREGTVMQRDSLMLWFSAGKPSTAVAVGQLVERGLLTWETRIGKIIPEFSTRGKEDITVRHLLTHTAGLRHADQTADSLVWDEKIARICALPVEADWVPGQRAGYHSSGTWYLLGELVRRISGQALEEFVREQIFLPLGLRNCFLALTSDDVALHGHRVAFVYDTNDGTLQPRQDWNGQEALMQCRPGGGARGPVRELGRFYESLLRQDGLALRPEMAATMTSRQRTGMFDETFQFQMDWGLGFILNSNREGLQMPYSFGRHASHDTFGHSGNQTSCAFADPQHQLVVAWACNGLPGERLHQRRQRAINNAIYEDLELPKKP